MKTFILDYSKWRCGGNNSKNRLGLGITSLHNEYGYMCCLGQACIQLGVPKKVLGTSGSPSSVVFYSSEYRDKLLLLAREARFSEQRGSRYINTELSSRAIAINDNTETTPEKKIKQLRALFKEHGIKMRVINRPKT